MLTKQYLNDSFGFANDLPTGGMPAYLNDLVQLEQSLKLNGLWSLVRNFNCVVSGCYVKTLNTTTKSITLTEGVIMINKIPYYVPEATYTYPFSFIAGTVTPDERLFLDTSLKQVGNSYDYSVRTSFTLSGNYPTDYTTVSTVNEIFFNPFTCQRLENILDFMSAKTGECKSFISNVLAAKTKTETGASISGSAISVVETETGPSSSLELYYEFAGWRWRKRITGNDDSRFNLNYGPSDSTAGVTVGRTSFNLIESNLPAHSHSSGSLIVDPHTHTYGFARDTGGGSIGGSHYVSSDTPSFVPTGTTSGASTNTISGNTGVGNGTSSSINLEYTGINSILLYKSTYPYKFHSLPIVL